MTQQNNGYYEKLYKQMEQQKKQIIQLLQALRDVPVCEEKEATLSLKQIRYNVEKQVAQRKHAALPEALQHVLSSEKESNLAVYQKLMQLLQKWTELQLALLKEWQKNSDNSSQTSETNMLFQEEDRLILQQFFMPQDEAQD